jgi:hypothetical protein
LLPEEVESMSEPNFQTVRLSKGKHTSPDEGACVIELASMLAGEPFSDRPNSVCPVIASFMRAYNDTLAAYDREELYPYAAAVVGSASSNSVTRARAGVMRNWVADRRSLRWLRLPVPICMCDWVAVTAARLAVAMPPEQRRTEVTHLMRALLAIGHEPGRGRVLAGAEEYSGGRAPSAVGD